MDNIFPYSKIKPKDEYSKKTEHRLLYYDNSTLNKINKKLTNNISFNSNNSPFTINSKIQIQLLDLPIINERKASMPKSIRSQNKFKGKIISSFNTINVDELIEEKNLKNEIVKYFKSELHTLNLIKEREKLPFKDEYAQIRKYTKNSSGTVNINEQVNELFDLFKSEMLKDYELIKYMIKTKQTQEPIQGNHLFHNLFDKIFRKVSLLTSFNSIISDNIIFSTFIDELIIVLRVGKLKNQIKQIIKQHKEKTKKLPNTLRRKPLVDDDFGNENFRINKKKGFSLNTKRRSIISKVNKFGFSRINFNSLFITTFNKPYKCRKTTTKAFNFMNNTWPKLKRNQLNTLIFSKDSSDSSSVDKENNKETFTSSNCYYNEDSIFFQNST